MDVFVWEIMKVSVVFLLGDCIKVIIVVVFVIKLYCLLKYIIMFVLKNGKYINVGW